MGAYTYQLAGKRIFVAGHNGMVGSGLIRELQRHEDVTILTAERATCDLARQDQVERWFAHNKPDVVINAAAKVGGIVANDTFPVDFLYTNLMIECNIMRAAFESGVNRMLSLGSSCIYPKFAPQPMPEECLLSGPLEPTNQWYAIAKIAGLKLCGAYRRQYGVDFISAMPTNLYGRNDNFELRSSHVVPALMRKMHEAKHRGAAEVEIWGTGQVLREFLNVDDLARACVFLLEHYNQDQHVNIGTGQEVSIKELASTMKRVTGFDGKLVFNTDYPDGTPRKLLDSGRILGLGWAPEISLEQGLSQTYHWFQDQMAHGLIRGAAERVVA